MDKAVLTLSKYSEIHIVRTHNPVSYQHLGYWENTVALSHGWNVFCHTHILTNYVHVLREGSSMFYVFSISFRKPASMFLSHFCFLLKLTCGWNNVCKLAYIKFPCKAQSLPDIISPENDQPPKCSACKIRCVHVSELFIHQGGHAEHLNATGSSENVLPLRGWAI